MLKEDTHRNIHIKKEKGRMEILPFSLRERKTMKIKAMAVIKITISCFDIFSIVLTLALQRIFLLPMKKAVKK